LAMLIGGRITGELRGRSGIAIEIGE